MPMMPWPAARLLRPASAAGPPRRPAVTCGRGGFAVQGHGLQQVLDRNTGNKLAVFAETSALNVRFGCPHEVKSAADIVHHTRSCGGYAKV